MKTIELTWDKEAADNYFIRESFNTLRTNLFFAGKSVKVIVLTSCFAHEGKTSVSFDLSRNLAESGKKVLYVDADLRNSQFLSRYTKESSTIGFSQLLSGQSSSDEVICTTNVENLDVLCSGTFPPNPTELFAAPSLKEFLDAEREVYDYIIIDAPPLGMVIDAAVIAGNCDGAIFVVNVGEIKGRIAQSVKMQLEKSGCKILGAVLNHSSHASHSSSKKKKRG